jgi:hypothetical protein
MGFTSFEAIHNVSLVPDTYLNSRSKDEKDAAEDETKTESGKLSDQEILESTEAIYFTENVDTGSYELKVGHWIILWIFLN